MEITLAELAHVCGVRDSGRLSALLPHLNASLGPAEITTTQRAAFYVANITHETRDLTTFEENLNYSAEGLVKTWPRHFQTPEIAAAYARQRDRIGNRAYADRLGNGDEASGDGWRYRGRGALQLTGFANYHRFEIETGIPVMRQPELLVRPEYAFLAAAKYWIWHGIDVLADRGDSAAVRKAVDGGVIGLEDVEARYRRFMEIAAPAQA